MTLSLAADAAPSIPARSFFYQLIIRSNNRCSRVVFVIRSVARCSISDADMLGKQAKVLAPPDLVGSPCFRRLQPAFPPQPSYCFAVG
jgi:hypothetical protein